MKSIFWERDGKDEFLWIFISPLFLNSPKYHFISQRENGHCLTGLPCHFVHQSKVAPSP